MPPLHLLFPLVAVLAATLPALAEQKLEVIEKPGVRYQLWRVESRDLPNLQLHWLDAAKQPLSNFGALQTHLASQGMAIVFATNAGIYERGPKPCGLTICQGRELVPLNLAAGEGNFYLKPNGVFYVDDKTGAGVMESAEFARSKLKPRLASQSGPLLLRHGKIHPAFDPHSKNLRQRSAVGVRQKDGQVIFVMTDRKDPAKRTVSFHALASFFLELGCNDALFLDGDLSDFAVNPPPAAVFRPQTYAAMFVLIAR